MRRFLLVIPVLLVLAVILVLTRGESGTTRQVADPVPYPRTTKPLPVSEIVIDEGPWQDPLPTPSAPAGFGRDGALPEGFRGCASASDTLPVCPID